MAGAAQKEDEPITAINVTPLVDVCLVLVIIFMAVAPMAVTLGIKVLETRPSRRGGSLRGRERPDQDHARRRHRRQRDEDGQDDVRVLAAALARSKDKMVIVTADAKNKVGLVVSVLDASKQAGALKLAVMKAAESEAKHGRQHYFRRLSDHRHQHHAAGGRVPGARHHLHGRRR